MDDRNTPSSLPIRTTPTPNTVAASTTTSAAAATSTPAHHHHNEHSPPPPPLSPNRHRKPHLIPDLISVLSTDTISRNTMHSDEDYSDRDQAAFRFHDTRNSSSPESMNVSPTGSESSDEQQQLLQQQQQQQQQQRRPSASSQNAPIRVDDYAYVMKNLLPEDPELETLQETYQTWTIKDWTKLSKREYGPTFSCGDAEWRVLFFPFGNNVEFAAFYLDTVRVPTLPDDWYRCVQFGLVLWNPNDPTLFISHSASHRFTPDESDWGFTRFCELRRLFNQPWDPARSNRPLVENDTVNLTTYVRVVKDPTGVLWHKFNNYNSKKETGMVGLKNQGATCYLNSLLQSLYFTNKFRKAVYNIPTEQDASKTNSAYTLQRLFYQLQTSESPVATTELTGSFGWESRQIFEQQDVQELSRKLMERLEEKMKGTSVEKALEELFVGKSKTYISCINVDFESSRVEEFWDIQLNVSGNKTLHDSFMDYIQVETLEGDNKYDAGEPHKLQDANKGVIFETMPDVLHLQLKRFEYDFTHDMMMKINDRHEFPEEFDAAPYLTEEGRKNGPWIYQLYGVLVHAGDLQAGHYYAYIRPTKDGHFYKYDDDRVTRATLRETLEENYGGEALPARNVSLHPVAEQQRLSPRTFTHKRANNAYMLVYIRKNKVDEIMQDVTEQDVPKHVAQAVIEERAEMLRRRKEREEQHLYLNVQLISEETFKHHTGFDLTGWELPPGDKAAPENMRTLRARTVADFTKEIAESRGLKPEQVRFWTMVNRQNKTVRPDAILHDPDMSLEEAYVKFGANKNSPFRLYLEVAPIDADGKVSWPEESSLSNGNGNNENITNNSNNSPVNNSPILIFLKYFDAPSQQIIGVCQTFVKKHSKIQELTPLVIEKMGWPSNTEIFYFEEIKHTMVESMMVKKTFQQSEIQDGDIICFQRKYSDSELAGIPFPGAKEYYDYLYHRRNIRFIPLKEDGGETFVLTLYGRLTYGQWTAKVGEHLNVDPTHIRFAPVTLNTGKPKPFIKRNSPIPLHQMMCPPQSSFGYSSHRSDTLFYEVLDQSLMEYESKKAVRLGWFGDGLSKETSIELLVPRQGDVTDLIALLRQKLNLSEEKVPKIRLFEVHNNRVFKDIPDSYGVTGFTEYAPLFAEPVPKEELEMREDEYKINVFHFDKEPNRPHGIPFKFIVKPGEIFKDTKERISNRINIRGKAFEKIKPAILTRPYNQNPPRYLADTDILSDLIGVEDERTLGLDHTNKTRHSWNRSESFSIR
ncbi:hypothetical protein KEM54_000337 [Ascosphaera aggregata]|nr:hypothetical protein KEM54_000337 [Ascosphaera aggregata]